MFSKKVNVGSAVAQTLLFPLFIGYSASCSNCEVEDVYEGGYYKGVVEKGEPLDYEEIIEIQCK